MAHDRIFFLTSMLYVETFRRIPDEEDKHLKKRHSNYHFLGKLLRECVELFGDSIFGSKIQSFYHAINEKIYVRGAVSRIKGVLSTSSSLPVVVNFAGTNGLILELKDGSNYASPKFFSCCWLSEFGNEFEHLFIGGECPLLFATILHPRLGIDYSIYLKALNIINTMMRGELFEEYEQKNKNDHYFGCVIKRLVTKLMFHQISKYLQNNIAKSHQSIGIFVSPASCAVSF